MKKIYVIFLLVITYKAGVAQTVNATYLNPAFNDAKYKYLRFGTSSDFKAGLMYNISDAAFGDGDDFSIFTYGNRDITLRPGSGKLIVFPTDGGNMGIGTKSPQSRLSINSNFSSIMRFSRSDANTYGFEIGGTTFGLYDYTDQQYRWRTNGDNILLAENSGNVNIGSSGANGLYKLYVNSPGSTRVALSNSNFTDNAVLEYHTSKQLRFQHWDDGTWKKSIMALDIPSGKVGVGTTTPYGNLHIETDKWSPALITLKDTHYSPHQVYNFQIESDGLKIKQNDQVNYQFKSGGNFIVNNGSLGIGTTSPLGKFHLDKGDIFISSSTNTNNAVHTGVKFTTDNSGYFSSIKTYRGEFSNRIGLRFQTMYGSQTPIEAMQIQPNGNIGIGTTTPDAKLAVNGNIHTREVKVDLQGWPDYVFEDAYDLPTLTQVEQHIAEKGHLINIPSAADVAENGIYLGEMNAKLLEKIEELTLYTIAQEKEIREQKSKTERQEEINHELLNKNAALEARLARIEALLNKE